MASWLLRRLRSDNGEGSARRAVDIMNPNDTIDIVDSSNHIREGCEFLLTDASGKEVLCSVETEAAREEWVSKIRAAVDEIDAIQGDGTALQSAYPSVQHEGPVRKRGQLNTAFASRYFVLSAGVLRYYKTKEAAKDRKTEPQGTLQCRLLRVEKLISWSWRGHFVDMSAGHLSLNVKRLISTAFDDTQLVITPEVLAMGPRGDGYFDEIIPFKDVDYITNVGGDEDGNVMRCEGSWSRLFGLCAIYTKLNGHNRGRTYLLSIKFPCTVLRKGAQSAHHGEGMKTLNTHQDGHFRSQAKFIKLLEALARGAAKRAEDPSWRGKFQRSRMFVHAIFQDVRVQVMVAVLLAANFAVNGYEAEVPELLHHETSAQDPELKYRANLFFYVDWGFTIVFAVELMLNIYAHWMDEFLADAWNIFDTIVVVISLVAPLLTAQNIPVTILRLLRAFRVLRLFGRLRSIRAIINALSKSIVPVANAFFIQFIVMALYAIMGVNLFYLRSPEDFGTFSRAIVTLFRIAAGETWIEGVPVLDEDGIVNWGVGVYIMSFTIIVNWTLLQVSVAVLLDNFVQSTGEEKKLEHDHLIGEKRARDAIGNVLDPLLHIICKEYIDEQHLTHFLRQLFALLLSLQTATPDSEIVHLPSLGNNDLDDETLLEKGGELTSKGLQQAFSRMDLKLSGDKGPEFHFLGQSVHAHQLHLTHKDYELITENGALAKPNGALGESEFCEVMRRQVAFYLRRKLQRSATETQTQHEFSLTCALKQLIGDMAALKQRQSAQDETLADIRSSLACLTEAVSCIPGCQKALAERDKAGMGGAGRVDRDGNGDGDGGDTGASIPLETSGFWPLGRLFDTPKPSGAFGAAANAETEGVQEGQPRPHNPIYSSSRAPLSRLSRLAEEKSMSFAEKGGSSAVTDDSEQAEELGQVLKQMGDLQKSLSQAQAVLESQEVPVSAPANSHAPPDPAGRPSPGGTAGEIRGGTALKPDRQKVAVRVDGARGRRAADWEDGRDETDERSLSPPAKRPTLGSNFDSNMKALSDRVFAPLASQPLPASMTPLETLESVSSFFGGGKGGGKHKSRKSLDGPWTPITKTSAMSDLEAVQVAVNDTIDGIMSDSTRWGAGAVKGAGARPRGARR